MSGQDTFINANDYVAAYSDDADGFEGRGNAQAASHSESYHERD